MAYTSSLKYEPERIHAAAIYCSDGRVGAHFDDFLTHGLKLPRYDRVALPGGPASLAEHTESHIEVRCVVEELRFLVEAHELQRVVLIAHQECAFYSARLHLAEAELERQQRADLHKAAERVREITGISEVEAYFARIDGEPRRIVFDPVSVER